MGGTSTRFAVSVPADLLEAVEEKVARKGEGRSALVRRLFEAALREAREREKVERYLRGYRQHPQTEEEFAWLDRAARKGLAAMPWE